MSPRLHICRGKMTGAPVFFSPHFGDGRRSRMDGGTHGRSGNERSEPLPKEGTKAPMSTHRSRFGRGIALAAILVTSAMIHPARAGYAGLGDPANAASYGEFILGNSTRSNVDSQGKV